MGIVLLGYRGSGKTTVARLLAAHFGWPAVDTDKRVIATAGKTIREIFRDGGETGFRNLEEIAVREACAVESVIIALGGGAILRSDNRRQLSQSRHERIYLRCDAQVLHARIHADPQTVENRPNLTHLGGTLAEIEYLLAQREPLYREVSTRELNVTSLLPEAATAAIVAMVE